MKSRTQAILIPGAILIVIGLMIFSLRSFPIGSLTAFANRNNAPIAFYGRAVDQDDMPLSGVTVHYDITKVGPLTYTWNTRKTSETNQCVTGTDGGFKIENGKGLMICFDLLEKAGYRDGGSNSSRTFAYRGNPKIHEANARSPVEFVMIRSDLPKPKLLLERNVNFAWNKGEVRTPVGDAVGAFIVEPSRVWEKGRLEDFDWHVTIRVEDAELVDLSNSDSTIAPRDGYKKKLEYGAKAGDLKWYRSIQSRYAFKTRDGRYGIIRFVLYGHRKDFEGNATLEVYLNKSGSRNLDL